MANNYNQAIDNITRYYKNAKPEDEIIDTDTISEVLGIIYGRDFYDLIMEDMMSDDIMEILKDLAKETADRYIDILGQLR